jgi:AcrR family transcriptional regulator
VTARLRRADARRNRERVLAAAEEVFAEQGHRAQVDEVARRAGVGVGTVCRNFPTKQALVQAVLEAMFESLRADAEAALAEPDAGAAFERFFITLAEFQARHRVLAEAMATDVDLPATAQPTQQALRRAISTLVANAQAAGAVRADIGATDVTMLFAGVAQTTALAGELQPLLRRRYLNIILDGLRPDFGRPLPGKPVDFAQLDRLKKRRERC